VAIPGVSRRLVGGIPWSLQDWLVAKSLDWLVCLGMRAISSQGIIYMSDPMQIASRSTCLDHEGHSSSYGCPRMAIAEGVEKIDRHPLRCETRAYNQLRTIQGIHVPVCLGITDLAQPYYCSSGVYVSFLMPSWAGKPLLRCIDKNASKPGRWQWSKALHQLHILHRDAELRNVVYDGEGQPDGGRF
jgi:hypothetical protein